MKSYKWDKKNQQFDQVDDPAYFPKIGDVAESLAHANYFVEFTSDCGDNEGATITVYMTEDTNKPTYYIDIMGLQRGIATLVAYDFPMLVDTLRQIHPLLTLVTLDQFSTNKIAGKIKK